jgi:hypothetical protein
MAKKKNNNPMAKPALPAAAPKKTAARKPKAKASVNSQLKATILSAPRSMKLDAAQSFMRTTAFTLQNKVRTAMTELSKVEKSKKTPSARLGLSYDSSVQPTSSQSFFSNPFNRFKIAFLTVVVIGGIGGYFYSDRVMDGFKSLGDAVSNVSHEKNWVEGMMTQTNGIPEDDTKDGTLMPPRMMEEDVVPVADEAPTAPASVSDVLPSEPVPEPAPVAAAPEPAAAPVVKAKAPEVKAPKAAKTSKKTKATKAAKTKAKSKAKAKSKKSAQK